MGERGNGEAIKLLDEITKMQKNNGKSEPQKKESAHMN